MRYTCIDCGKDIRYRGSAHEIVNPPAEGIPSIRDRCIPCGAMAGSPWIDGPNFEGRGEIDDQNPNR